MYPIPELAKLMRASLPACSSSEMPCRSTCTLSNTLARSLLYYFRHRLKSSVCRVKGLSAGGADAHHRPVQEGVDVEHGLQLQGVIHTVVLITIPATETWSGHNLSQGPSREGLLFCHLYMLPRVSSMFGFWNSIPGRKFFLAGLTRNGVSTIYKHTRVYS